MIREHLLERRQWVDRPLGETFELFSDAFALERITPPWLQFEVLTPPPIEMAEGTLIDYALRLHGVPVRWRTRIEVWEPPHRFTDRQLSGPYRRWHHAHELRERAGRTEIADHVRYSMPLGVLGELARAVFVRKNLEKIFDYRHVAVERLLSERSSDQSEGERR